MYWPSISLHFGKIMCSHGGGKKCVLIHFKVRQNFHWAERPWQLAAAISVCMCALSAAGHSCNGSPTAQLRSGLGISHELAPSRVLCASALTQVTMNTREKLWLVWDLSPRTSISMFDKRYMSKTYDIQPCK